MGRVKVGGKDHTFLLRRAKFKMSICEENSMCEGSVTSGKRCCWKLFLYDKGVDFRVRQIY